MKKHLLYLVIAISLISCSERTYVYQTELLKPSESKELVYENDTLKISFLLQPKYIEVNLFNKTDDGVRINWDEVSFSINGKAQRIVHKETATDKVTETQPPTSIPPKSNLRDLLLSTDYLTYRQLPGQKLTVSILEMFPNADYGSKKRKAQINALRGTKVMIYLPFYMRGNYVGKSYEIWIRDIKQVEQDKKRKKK